MKNVKSNISDKDITDIVKDAFLRVVDDGNVPTAIELNSDMFAQFKSQFTFADTLMDAGWKLSIDTPRGKLPTTEAKDKDAPMCNIIFEHQK